MSVLDADPSVRTETVPWQFVPRYRRKGYMDRDFFISGRRYRPFASGANEHGIIRYGVDVGPLDYGIDDA